MSAGRYFRHLILGFCLMGATASILLYSDWSQRRTGGGHLPRIAVLQHASQAALDEGVKGMLDSLADAGFVDGKTAIIKKFNAENDLATANANKNRGIKHVF